MDIQKVRAIMIGIDFGICGSEKELEVKGVCKQGGKKKEKDKENKTKKGM